MGGRYQRQAGGYLGEDTDVPAHVREAGHRVPEYS
jgi:hypothetical protein